MSLADVFPHLRHLQGNTLPNHFSPIDVKQAAHETDLLFTALPSGVSGQLIPELLEAGCRIIDLSGDLRIPSYLYKEWYAHEPVSDSLLEHFTYGLSELFHDSITQAVHISNPGCYATAVQLALAPMIQKGMVRYDNLIVDAKSGVSGAGRNAKVTNLFAEANENLSLYKVGRHQHTPEIEFHLQRLASLDQQVRISFTPQLVPMTRGILCTIYAEGDSSWQSGLSTEILLETLRSYYREAPFIRICPAEKMPATRHVWGTNFCDIGAYYEERTKRIILVSAIDNLVKGASGQAVQNFNLMYGFPEDMGFNQMPINP